MKCIVAGHVAVTVTEFTELALGLDLELFTGPPLESPLERAARLDAARDILAELRQSDPESATYAEALMRTTRLPVGRTAKRRPNGTGGPAAAGVAA